MNHVSKAVVGTEDYHEVMREAAQAGLKRMVGYIPPIGDFTPPRQTGFLFTIIKPAKNPLVSFDIPEQATVFRLDKGIKLQIYKPERDNCILTYGYVSVYATFVMFHWINAETTDFEWAQIEISHHDLIEIQHEDAEQRRVWLNLMWNRVWNKWE